MQSFIKIKFQKYRLKIQIFKKIKSSYLAAFNNIRNIYSFEINLWKRSLSVFSKTSGASFKIT